MKIVKYTGGLGNQMFQYSFSLALEKHGQQVFADTDLYRHNQVRGGIDLSHGGFEVARVFALDVKEAAEKDVYRLGNRANGFFERLRRKFFTKPTHVIEYDSVYHPQLLDDSRDLYLDGYWQNPEYFKGIEPEIKKAFSFKLPLNKASAVLAGELESSAGKTCAVHVRRGDYLNSKSLFLCGKKYFDGALAKIKEITGGIDRFVIFSDDIEWCRNNLPLEGSAAVFVDWNRGPDSWQDIALMTMCHNAVIPNSSFSFWGAWLNRNPDAKIICPEIWNISGAKDIVPAGWITVPAGI